MGATVDLNILNYVMSSPCNGVGGGDGSGHPEFVMEVTDKTRADVKVSLFGVVKAHNKVLLSSRTFYTALKVFKRAFLDKQNF
jgi:UDP-N-acetylglucosamine pyrophosphorylase